MSILFYFIILLLLPSVLMFPLWIKAFRIKRGQNNVLILNIGNAKIITNKKGILTALIYISIIFALGSIPFFPFFGYVFIFISSIFLSQKLNVIEKKKLISINSAVLKTELELSLDKIKKSISSVESLAMELEAKNIEIVEKDTLTQKLDVEIENKLNEYENWKNLSKEEKKLFIAAVDKTVNKKGTINFLSLIVGSIILNLAANLIWALLGNPDKLKIIDIIKNYLGLNL